MQKVYKISVFKTLALQFTINCLEFLLSAAGLIYFVTADSNEYKSFSFVIPVLFLFLIFSFAESVRLAILLSYKITITDDGQLVESQMFHNDRILSIQDISQIKWDVVGILPGLGELLLGRWGGNVGDTIGSSLMKSFNRPIAIGRLAFYGWGTRLINATYSNFPRYATSSLLANYIKSLKPDIICDQEALEHQQNVQARRREAFKWLLIGLISFAIIIGLLVLVKIKSKLDFRQKFIHLLYCIPVTSVNLRPIHSSIIVLRPLQ
jgi:hypothetical protein